MVHCILGRHHQEHEEQERGQGQAVQKAALETPALAKEAEGAEPQQREKGEEDKPGDQKHNIKPEVGEDVVVECRQRGADFDHALLTTIEQQLSVGAVGGQVRDEGDRIGPGDLTLSLPETSVLWLAGIDPFNCAFTELAIDVLRQIVGGAPVVDRRCSEHGPDRLVEIGPFNVDGGDNPGDDRRFFTPFRNLAVLIISGRTTVKWNPASVVGGVVITGQGGGPALDDGSVGFGLNTLLPIDRLDVEEVEEACSRGVKVGGVVVYQSSPGIDQLRSERVASPLFPKAVQ